MAKRRYGGAGSNFSIRLDDEMRGELQRAAEANGRSLNEEIRQRLSRTGKIEKSACEAFGDLRTYAFYRLLHLAAPLALDERRRQRHWLDDPYQYAQHSIAMRAILAALTPKKGTRQPKNEPDATYLGLMQAATVLRGVKDPAWLREEQAAVRRAFPKDMIETANEMGFIDQLFSVSVEIGINEYLGDVLERVPDDLLTSPETRAEFERTES